MNHVTSYPNVALSDIQTVPPKLQSLSTGQSLQRKGMKQDENFQVGGSIKCQGPFGKLAPIKSSFWKLGECLGLTAIFWPGGLGQNLKKP